MQLLRDSHSVRTRRLRAGAVPLVSQQWRRHIYGCERQSRDLGGKAGICNYFGIPTLCGPGGFEQEPCRLYHNNGDGTFTDVSAKAGISAVKPGYATTSGFPLCADPAASSRSRAACITTMATAHLRM